MRIRNFLTTCLQVALAIMAVGVFAMTARAQQHVPAASAVKHDQSYLVYAGTYSRHGSKGIYLFRFDERTGSMTAMGLAAEIASPTFLITDSRHRFLYTVTEPANAGSLTAIRGGSVSSFSIDQKTGALRFLNNVPSGGRGPTHLALDKTGKILFVANYQSGSVASFSIEDNGSIGAMTKVDQHQGSSVDPLRQEGPHAHMVVVSRDNRFLFVPDLGLDKIFIYKIDVAKRSFTANEPAYVSVKPGLGPRHFAFGADAKFAYAVCEMGTSVVAFKYDAAKGSLTPIQTISILPADFKGQDQGSEIQIDGSGRSLYTSNQGMDANPDLVDGRITVFEIDGKTGLLKLRQIEPSGGKLLRYFALDPSGKFLLAGNLDSDRVAEFTVAGDGQIAPTKQSVEIPAPTSQLFIPAP